MQSLDKNRSAQIRQEAQEAVYRAQRELRRARVALVAAWVGMAAVAVFIGWVVVG